MADSGTPALSVTNSFVLTVDIVNSAPVFPVQAPRSVNELVQLTVTNTATDSDFPANLVTYQLLNPPEGVTIDSAGVIRWTPSEAHGPHTFTITAVATDNGTPAMSATNNISVTVNEVNSAPVLTVPANATINELTLYTNSATAADADLPPNALTFALVSGPSWTDGFAFGLYFLDADRSAGSQRQCRRHQLDRHQSGGGQRQVVQRHQLVHHLRYRIEPVAFAGLTGEPNHQRVRLLERQPLGDRSEHSAQGTDLLPRLCTHGHDHQPEHGFHYLDADRGPGPSTNVVSVQVANSLGLSTSQSFQVAVNEVNVAPVLTVPANVTINKLTLYTSNATATDADLPVNNLTFALVSGPSGLTVSPAGAIAWTPSEAQSSTTNLIRISVADTNPAAVNTRSLSATNSFTIVVSATVGSRPLLDTPVLTSTTVTLFWSSIPGRTYRLQYTPNLNGNNWIDLPGDVTASGTTASKADTRTTAPRFYRVALLP